MGDVLRQVVGAAGFMPHGHCYLWKPELVWLNVVSDAPIGIAYVAISTHGRTARGVVSAGAPYGQAAGR